MCRFGVAHARLGLSSGPDRPFRRAEAVLTPDNGGEELDWVVRLVQVALTGLHGGAFPCAPNRVSSSYLTE